MNNDSLRREATSGQFVLAAAGDVGYEPLADVVVLPAHSSLPDAQAALTSVLSRLPGLTLAASEYAGDHRLLATSNGETVSARGSSVVAWATVGYLRILTCGRLTDRHSVRRGLVEGGEASVESFLLRAVDVLAQLQRLGQVTAGSLKVSVITTDLPIGDQHVRVEYRRT